MAQALFVLCVPAQADGTPGDPSRELAAPPARHLVASPELRRLRAADALCGHALAGPLVAHGSLGVRVGILLRKALRPAGGRTTRLRQCLPVLRYRRSEERRVGEECRSR